MQVDHSQKCNLADLAEYSLGSVVSRAVLKSGAGNITLFAFDKGEGLSAHSAPFDAFVYVMDGKAKIMIGDQENELSSGEMIIMPANVTHAVFAEEAFKMLLVMIKGEKK